jgi:hypothetical protein
MTSDARRSAERAPATASRSNPQLFARPEPHARITMQPSAARVWRGVHRLHRVLGSVLCVLLMIWFASGAAMSFVRYPEYSDRERLRDAAPLARVLPLELPPQLYAWIARGGLATGARLRMSQLEGQATWTLSLAGTRRAFRATAPFDVSLLDASRALREAERRFQRHGRIIDRLFEADQWTVGRSARAEYPLYRIGFDDRERSEVYVSARTGEVVQRTTRESRLFAWLGPIPHWIYPALLRRHRAVWRNTVLVLASLGLLSSVSGLVAGLHAARVKRRRARTESAANHAGVNNVYLRWHQRIGLGFGGLVSTWLFSGALSLTPFAWSGPDVSDAQLAQIHRATPLAAPIDIAKLLEVCSAQLQVKELELVSFADSFLAVCSSEHAVRVIDLAEAPWTARRSMTPARIARLAGRFAPSAHVQLRAAPDLYYYATHSDPEIASPYVRLDLADIEHTSLYIDAARGALLAKLTDRKRIERFLYHGLHSLDFPGLYDRPLLWRSVIALAMAAGFSLSLLGLLMLLRRSWLRSVRSRREDASNR